MVVTVGDADASSADDPYPEPSIRALNRLGERVSRGNNKRHRYVSRRGREGGERRMERGRNEKEEQVR